MVQELTTNSNIFGRLGSGIGQGLAEQIPKEIEHQRLRSGLQNLAQKAGELSPEQYLAEAAGTYGITPQMIQSFGEIAKQKARGQALIQSQNSQQKQQAKNSPFPQQTPKATSPSGSEIPSITKPESLEKIQEGFIPPTQDELFERAGKMYNANPALFNHDPAKAIEVAENAALRDERRIEAHQRHHANLTALQSAVGEKLAAQAGRLEVKIPSNIYTKIEDEAIQAVQPKSKGGRGLTEQQAMKEFGEKLDGISRDYKAIDTLGGWGIVARPAAGTLSNIKNLQKKFDKRGDTENFGDELISKLSLSPILAYSLAEPVSRSYQLNNALKSLPKLKPIETLFESKVPDKILRDKTLEVSKKLAPLLKDQSPLAVAFELKKLNYDPNIWLDYLIDNRENLDLKESQGRQLDKPDSAAGTLSDWWLSAWSGIE